MIELLSASDRQPASIGSVSSCTRTALRLNTMVCGRGRVYFGPSVPFTSGSQENHRGLLIFQASHRYATLTNRSDGTARRSRTGITNDPRERPVRAARIDSADIVFGRHRATRRSTFRKASSGDLREGDPEALVERRTFAGPTYGRPVADISRSTASGA
jgi:hypothetical protein